MQLSTWIAIRYLFSGSVGRYAPLLTATAVTSVAVGMTALILVMSVMLGFRQELSNRLLGFNAHITITREAGAEPIPKAGLEEILSGIDFRDLAPFVQGEVIAQSEVSGDLLAQGARVRGIEPQGLGAMDRLDFYFPEESAGFSALSNPSGNGLKWAIVGNEIVSQISVHPDFKDKIKLVAPLAEVGPTGEFVPNEQSFVVAGVFRAGIFDYDSKYIFVSLPEAERLLGEQAKSGWQVRLGEMKDLSETVSLLRAKLPQGWDVKGWDEQNRKLFAALKLERFAMGSVLFMALLIASFSIVGVVMLVTAAKRKDIAILESIGMTNKGVGRIFLIHAALIGGLGSLIGIVCGVGVCLIITRWPIRLPQSYYLDWLPVDIEPLWAGVFALVGIAVAVVSSLYPVRQAMRSSPVEILRYE